MLKKLHNCFITKQYYFMSPLENSTAITLTKLMYSTNDRPKEMRIEEEENVTGDVKGRRLNFRYQ